MVSDPYSSSLSTLTLPLDIKPRKEKPIVNAFAAILHLTGPILPKCPRKKNRHIIVHVPIYINEKYAGTVLRYFHTMGEIEQGLTIIDDSDIV